MTTQRPLSILFADSDLAATRPARVDLRRRGAHVSWAGSSADASRQVLVQPPDLLVLDDGLDSLEGVDPIEYFSDRLPEAEIILLHSRADPTPLDSGLGLLFSAHKPISKRALIDVIITAFPGRLAETSFPAPEAHTLLCVDDDQTYLTALSRFLERRGYHVLAYQNARRALEALSKHEPQLAIVDILMPEMDGLSLAHRIHERSQGKLPVVILTALNSKEVYGRARESGASYCLTKPCQPQDLLNVVDFIAGDLDPDERNLLQNQLKTKYSAEPRPL